MQHKDKILFLGRKIGENELEGTVQKISNEAHRLFKEYAVLLSNKGEFVLGDTKPLLSEQIK